ncbi:MAG: hypothetical protein B6D72_04715 [gamma proteobacterium symbiont of Ctena orbiculata]|nr:MAG: hypothetical protein B6D72_04715 [gamma proteobacterium symbiont of Ctena orbiculata]
MRIDTFLPYLGIIRLKKFFTLSMPKILLYIQLAFFIMACFYISCLLSRSFPSFYLDNKTNKVLIYSLL